MTLIEWKQKAQDMLKRSPDVHQQFKTEICIGCQELVDMVSRIEDFIETVRYPHHVIAKELEEIIGK